MMTTDTMPLPAVGTPHVGVQLRPLEPGDSAAVLGVFAGLGPRSRQLRFLAAKPRLTTADVRHLVAVDGCDHVAVLASDLQDRPIGIARFIRDRADPSSAEVAVAVVDAWQGRGVGTRLLDAIAGRAVEVGVRRLSAFVSPDNRAVRGLLRRAPGTVTTVGADRWLTEYSVSLEGGRR